MNVDAIPLNDARGAELAHAPFASALIDSAHRETFQESARRLATGAGLGALFGAAIGLRAGGPALLSHALGVSVGMLSVALLAVPSLGIVTSLANAPIDGAALARATSRAAAKAGLVLGGLAPATALYVMTVEDAITVTVVGTGSLLLAGAIGARSFTHELTGPLRDAPAATRAAMTVAIPTFLVFAAALASRVFWMLLPILRGLR
jgi:hypothetical protein